jgi:hypothetical protein
MPVDRVHCSVPTEETAGGGLLRENMRNKTRTDCAVYQMLSPGGRGTKFYGFKLPGQPPAAVIHLGSGCSSVPDTQATSGCGGQCMQEGLSVVHSVQVSSWDHEGLIALAVEGCRPPRLCHYRYVCFPNELSLMHSLRGLITSSAKTRSPAFLQYDTDRIENDTSYVSSLAQERV